MCVYNTPSKRNILIIVTIIMMIIALVYCFSEQCPLKLNKLKLSRLEQKEEKNLAIELLSYKNSFLNPLLKIIIVIVFGIGTYYFFKARQKYGGELKRIANLLFWGGVAGLASSAFRFAGDFIIFWKWGESLLFLIFGLTSFYVAYLVRFRFIEAAKALGLMRHD